ncbi:carbohydrate esterase family 4 protein [Ramaria rubella]|nr:carbohydrate esterase family 4 protein [Ramaria rubella]
MMLSLLAPLAFALLTPSPAAAQLATVYSSCVKANTVALTFDDGPYIYETQIATTLKNAGIKGTFFVNGNNWECIYDDAMVKSIQNAYADGHEFGSHTWHHYDLTTLPWDGTGGIHDEMWRTERKLPPPSERSPPLTLISTPPPRSIQIHIPSRNTLRNTQPRSLSPVALQRIIGVSPAMMRPPYGTFNDEVRSASFIRNQHSDLSCFCVFVVFVGCFHLSIGFLSDAHPQLLSFFAIKRRKGGGHAALS